MKNIGGGGVWLTRNPKKDFYSEEHRDEGPRFIFDWEIYPEAPAAAGDERSL